MNLNLLKDKASKGTVKVMNAKERRCFTIIELLVIISIIAILASLLLPALSSVREKGKAIACQSNMKQLAYAWSFYTSDYQEWCPGPFYNGFYSKDRWFLEFRDSRYINEKVTKCPSSNYWEFNARSINYGVPGYVFGFTDYKKQAVKTTDPVFKRPTRTATFLESMPEGRYHEIGISGANWNGDGIGYQYEYPNYNAKTLGINYYVREYRHGQKKYLNAAFLDGHVDKRSYKSFIRRCTVMPVLDWALIGERVLCHPNGNCPE